MHPDRHFNPTQTAVLRLATRLIGLLIVVVGAAACSSPTPATSVEAPASPTTTVPSLRSEPLRTTTDLDAADSGAVLLENLPIVPNDGTTLLELTAPESVPSRWLLTHIDEPTTVAFSRSRSGNFDTLDVSGTSGTPITEIETQLTADGWTTRPSSETGLTASQGDVAAELTTIDVQVNGPDLAITITAPTGMLDLGWVHEWWTQPLAGAGIDGTPTRMNVRWQKTGQCDGCTSTRLSVVVDADDLDVNELAGRLAATRSGWTMAQDPGWVVVTSPDGRDMTIGSEPGELAVTIESEVALNGAVTVEETDERSFGDYVCWLLAGEISDLDGASSWDEFAAPIWNDLSADPELAELFDRDPSVFAEHVEASAYEVCSGLAESFADGSGRELVQQGYDSAVIED